MRVRLRPDPFEVSGYTVQRSGVRWLCDDAHLCRRGELVAYCNIGLSSPGQTRNGRRPFMDEGRDLQVAFATCAAGRFFRSDDASLGGFLYRTWTPDFAIGEIDVESGARDEGAGDVELLMLAGRRATELAEVRSGLLTGWHDRARGWWGDGSDGGDGRFGTLLGLGICDQAGILRGERFAFTELFDAVRGPAHTVFVPDDALVPGVPVLSDQLERSEADFNAIAADFARTFCAGSEVPTPHDWIFVGSLLSALRRSPLTDRYDIISRRGLAHAGPPETVLLSLNSEAQHVLRHRRLGYTVQCHVFRLAETGPAVRAWLRTNFEVVTRTPATVHADYTRFLACLAKVRGEAGAPKLLVMNAMSTSGREELHGYAGFDAPLTATLASVRAKELNLMLHDLEASHGIVIVDVDAIAAELGGGENLPDGIHFSGAMDSAVRSEVLRIARSRGVPGFAPRTPEA